ncbi:MAG: dicarboxylate/amino acid:cation symporter [Planctomycetaceae bacterium]
MTSERVASGHHLTLWIVIAIVLAIVISTFVPWLGLQGLDPQTDAAAYAARVETLTGVFRWISLGGDIFLRLLKMMVVPLVMTSVMAGILGLGDVRKLGRPGAWTILLYISTTVAAVLLGLLVVNLIDPGEADIDRAQAEALVAANGDEVEKKGLAVKEDGVGVILHNLALMLFTDNLFAAAVKGDLLPLIVFSVVFAGMLTTLGRRVDTLMQLIDQANHAIMAFVLLLMQVAPLGIFCLVAGRFGLEMLGGRFLSTLQLVWWYSVTVLVGLSVHAFVTLPLMVMFFTRRNPYRFLSQMSQALLTAFSTASSSATLPVTMECAVDRGGLSRKSVDFVLPLGATINMDGTALYEAVAAIFIAQFLGYDLTLGQQAVVAMTATLAAIGAAGIPEAGLVTMLIVLNAVGLPLQYQALIIPVDWLLDRFRTAVNVWGDACVASVVDRGFPRDMLIAEAGASVTALAAPVPISSISPTTDQVYTARGQC